MHKEKVSFKYRITHFFTYHPWLKLIALILAFLIWFYVTGEIANTN